ncbi:DUF58 domain-containing protein [Herbiconiux liangxiaofengii]|uniref:DUF58 domain-containing protein n=1 Tax=Herbiconiux liangxiaofengii TaxID=3342795 RepID=UPI0035B98648
MAAPRPERSLPRLTVRGWGLVVAAVAAFVLTQVLRRQELAYLACFLLAVPLLALAWVALRRVALTVRRTFTPESGTVGDVVTATMFLRNWGGLRTPAAVWRERTAAPLEPAPPAPFPSLDRYSSSTLDEPVPVRLDYRLDTRFRGEHPIGPLELTVTDPFGCATRRLGFGGTDTVLITPTVYELARIDLRLSTGDGAEQVSRRLVGAGEQDVIARKYLPGDSIRRVHWPATAKHGELMVRQDDQRNDQDAVIVLDAHSFATGPGFEWAVSTMASVAVHLMNEGYGVRLVGHVAGGDDEVLVAPFGAARAMRALARTGPDAVHDADEFRQVVDDAALTSPDAPPLFALVSDEPGAADRIRGLASMSSHAVAFVVSDGDDAPSTGRAARGRRHPDAAAAAVASPVAAELRSSGWTVVPCGPDDHLPAVWHSLGEARGLA